MKLEDAPEVLTVEEAADYLRIGRSAAYEAVRRGQLPAVRLGRKLRVPKAAIEALLAPTPLGTGPPGQPKGRPVSGPSLEQMK